MEFKSHSVSETIQIGKEFAESLKPGDVILLEGDLGAGKTHFVKGVASFFGIEDSQVSSPTFTLIHEYDGGLPIYHLDCYRLKSEQEALEIGIEEYLYGDGVTLIEWPSKITALLPKESHIVEIKHSGESERTIFISNRS